jgi:hypothetical protein
MFEAYEINDDNFLYIYFGKYEINTTPWISGDLLYLANNVILMSPFNYSEFCRFVADLEKTRPLLAELR